MHFPRFLTKLFSTRQQPTNILWKDTVPFVLPVSEGRVIKCYDGDTITIVFKMPNDNTIYRASVRLNGIDCPELKSNNEYEKECAKIAKQRVEALILNRIIYLENIKTEKYGRALADVYFKYNESSKVKFHLNDLLIKERLAVAYDGGTKKCPENWMEYYKNGVF